MNEGVPSSLSLRLKGVLALPLESDDLVLALNQLSEFYGPNTTAARRNLRGDLERRGLDINARFLAAFEDVQMHLESVQADIDAMGASCVEMRTTLAGAREQTHEFLRDTDKLLDERAKLDACSEIVSGFLARFQLSPSEVAALKATPLGADFFPALDRVHAIHADCNRLLRTKEAGLEIVNMMVAHMDTAYERLYRWVQAECRALDKDVADVPELLRSAVAALQRRPLLFSACLEEVASARRAAVQRGFFDALTRGGPNGIPRPIELHAHDPMRYVGDMLAWLHQCVAWEHELVAVLFGLDSRSRLPRDDVDVDTIDSKPGALEVKSESERRDEARQLLDGVFSGVCRNFEVRFEQALVTKPNAVTAYKLSSLLDFYRHTISKLMGEGGSLVRSVMDARQKAMTKCFELLSTHADKMLRSPPPPPPDLTPPPAATEMTSRLGEVLGTFDASLVPPEERATEFAPVLKALLEPLIRMCTLSASSLNAADMSVFLINTLDGVRAKLAAFEFAAAALEGVEAQIDAHLETLVNEQANNILHSCGVARKLLIIEQDREEGVPLSEVEGMDAQAMTDAMRAFDAFLSSTSVLAMPECDRLLSVDFRMEARSRVSGAIAAAYTVLYEAVTDKANKYKDVSSILLHSPEQVKTLLA